MTQQNDSSTNDHAAHVFGLVLLCIGLGLAYFVWPAGVSDTPLGAMTFGALLRAIVAIGISVAALVVALMFWI
jgi:hypothetical protein